MNLIFIGRKVKWILFWDWYKLYPESLFKNNYFASLNKLFPTNEGNAFLREVKS